MTLARRSLAGKNFISLNIMWAYREQASFAVRIYDLKGINDTWLWVACCRDLFWANPALVTVLLQLTEEEHLNRLDYVAEALRRGVHDASIPYDHAHHNCPRRALHQATQLLQGLGTSEGSQTVNCRAALQTPSW